MDVLDRLGERVPEGGGLRRIVLFGPETGAAHLSCVLVRLPPGHEFALHTHPRSEDCFFVLAGSGEAFEPWGAHPIAAPSGVWIPTGRAHGLRAGAGGMLEIGFQSPPDHTAVPCAGGFEVPGRARLLARSLARGERAAAVAAPWRPAFPERPTWRWLDARSAMLASGGRMLLEAGEGEAAIVVASGGIEIGEPRAARLSAPAVVRLAAGDALAASASADGTLLITVIARPRRDERLETPRLVLDPFRPADLDELHRLFNDGSVRRFLLGDALVPRAWVADEIAASEGRFAESGAGLWAVREKGAGTIAGFAGFRPFHDPPETQLLYGLLPAHWRRGLATEAARAVVTHAFGALHFRRVVAAADRPNEASIRLMRRLGMRHERDTADGEWGTVFYVVTDAEWAGA